MENNIKIPHKMAKKTIENVIEKFHSPKTNCSTQFPNNFPILFHRNKNNVFSVSNLVKKKEKVFP